MKRSLRDSSGYAASEDSLLGLGSSIDGNAAMYEGVMDEELDSLRPLGASKDSLLLIRQESSDAKAAELFLEARAASGAVASPSTEKKQKVTSSGKPPTKKEQLQHEKYHAASQFLSTFLVWEKDQQINKLVVFDVYMRLTPTDLVLSQAVFGKFVADFIRQGGQKSEPFPMDSKKAKNKDKDNSGEGKKSVGTRELYSHIRLAKPADLSRPALTTWLSFWRHHSHCPVGDTEDALRMFFFRAVQELNNAPPRARPKKEKNNSKEESSSSSSSPYYSPSHAQSGNPLVTIHNPSRANTVVAAPPNIFVSTSGPRSSPPRLVTPEEHLRALVVVRSGESSRGAVCSVWTLAGASVKAHIDATEPHVLLIQVKMPPAPPSDSTSLSVSSSAAAESSVGGGGGAPNLNWNDDVGLAALGTVVERQIKFSRRLAAFVKPPTLSADGAFVYMELAVEQDPAIIVKMRPLKVEQHTE